MDKLNASEPLVSIIIRTKNEEKWISRCLSAVFKQKYKNFEVVVVDNESNDRTLEIVRGFPCKIVMIKEYLPGRALNIGIRDSNGEYLACLSGHCVPVDELWLTNLLKAFSNPSIGGVYGRQEPLIDSDAFDKRDLLITFGLDKKIQEKDSFFHNANSMIKRKFWEEIPFNEEVTNIEDRIWAKEVLKRGYKVVYEPEASVFHYHGIHHGRDLNRCESTVKIIEKIEGMTKERWDEWLVNKEEFNIVAIIPLRREREKGAGDFFINEYLIKKTIEDALKSKLIHKVIVSSSDNELISIAKKYGAEVPFVRPEELSQPSISLDRVLKHAVEWLEQNENYKADIVVLLEINHPFRSFNLIDEVINRLIIERMDSVFAGKKEFKSCWKLVNGSFDRIDDGFMPKEVKRPIYIGLTGLACATMAKFIKQGRRLGNKIGILDVEDPYALIDISNCMDAALAKQIIEKWGEMKANEDSSSNPC
jgi:glycosyltransferase involved in cell wall biosynthesis